MRARDRAIKASLDAGYSLRATAKAFGVSPSTAWRAAGRARNAEREKISQPTAGLKVAG